MINWNKHSNLSGSHALMSPSQYAWLNDDDEKFRNRVRSWEAAKRGTELHAIAADLIEHGIALPRSKKTYNRYVNDGIGFRMRPEQLLFYSLNCFGTADTISFDEKKGFLRIHDLKTGKMPCKLTQLEIYAALFCLEHGIKPGDIEMELRIYQNDDILQGNPDATEILPIMDNIIHKDQILQDMKGE